jgi:RNA polymerase sigma-70 factor (ECF subfamily)
MKDARTTASPKSAQAGWFPTTRWTTVLAISGSDSHLAEQALATLCQIYWYPLYAYARAQAHTPEAAEDLTQAFFVRLLERRDLHHADRQKGRFRSYLLAAFRHFLADEFDKTTALKRGGGQIFISIDAQTAEERFQLEPVDALSPDKIYERRWALTVLDEALTRLKADYDETGKTQLYCALEGLLTRDGQQASYAAIGRRLGLSESAVKSALHRLRQRHRELIREEVAQTVGTSQEVDDEVRHLIAVLSD